VRSGVKSSSSWESAPETPVATIVFSRLLLFNFTYLQHLPEMLLLHFCLVLLSGFPPIGIGCSRRIAVIVIFCVLLPRQQLRSRPKA
jgi:hypothetical protein